MSGAKARFIDFFASAVVDSLLAPLALSIAGAVSPPSFTMPLIAAERVALSAIIRPLATSDITSSTVNPVAFTNRNNSACTAESAPFILRLTKSARPRPSLPNFPIAFSAAVPTIAPVPVPNATSCNDCPLIGLASDVPSADSADSPAATFRMRAVLAAAPVAPIPVIDIRIDGIKAPANSRLSDSAPFCSL